MSSYAFTRSRIFQWMGIILALGIMAVGYWYYRSQASTVNKSPTDMLTNSLVGYWTFDGADVSGTTATDRSGNSNTGTLTNSPTVTEGKVGQTLDFDGTTNNQRVNAGSGASLDDLSALTVSAWINPRGTGKNGLGVIIAKASTYDPNSGWAIRYNAGKIYFSVAHATTYLVREISASAVTTNTWQHLVVTWDGSTTATNVHMYVDGAESTYATTTNGAGARVSDAAQSLSIGCDIGNGATTFNGKIDEVRVYNAALSDAQIQSLYALGQSDKINSSISNPQGTGRLDSGLVGYWALDDGSGTSATDSSTNGNTGTLTNDPTWTTGQIGSGVDFDGSNDYIELGSSIRVGNSDRGVFTTWVNIDTNAGTNKYLFGYGGGAASSAAKFTIYIDGPTDTVAIEQVSTNGGTFNTLRGSTALGTGTWYHVAVVSDGSTYVIYVNGKTETLTVSGGSNNGNWLGDTSPTAIVHSLVGAAFYNGIYSGYIDAKIDDVRLYDRTLTADEVSQLYRLTTPTSVDTSLKGYWSFNAQDMNSTTAYDRSGAGNNGTLTNGPTVIPGKVGQALNFTPDDAYVAAADNDALDLQSTLAGTFSAWIYNSGDTAGYQNIVYKNGVNIPWQIYLLDNTLDLGFYSTTSTAVDSGYAIPTGRWVHVAVTVSSTTTLFYVDGVLVATKTGQIGGNGDGSLAIGRGPSSTNDFNGYIDEVRVYNTVLSAAQIKALYDQGQSDSMNSSASQPQGTGRLDSGLAGYWKMDDGSGTSATDSSTNGNTGTLTNGPTWTTGQIGGAVDFDGTNDYVNVSDNDALDATSAVTIAAWIRADTWPSSYAAIVNKNGNYIFRKEVTPNNDLEFYWWDGTNLRYIKNAAMPSTGVWHHVVAVAENNDAAGIYVDGVLASSGGSFSAGASTRNLTNAFQIGGDNAGASQFDGRLDDVRVYNRALSSGEIAQLYRLSSPTDTDTSLKGYWSFNGKDMNSTTAFDRSGAGNNGTLTNGPVVTEGKIGQGLSFDGVDDYVDLGTGSGIRFTTTGTIAVWVKTSCTGTCIIVGGNSETEIGYNLFLESGTLKYRQDKYNEMSTPWTGVYNDGNWHYIVVTKSGSNGTLYVDNVSKATSTGLLGSWGANPIYIGNESSRSYYFVGSMDEVRIYNTALTTAQIQALYNSSK